MATYPGYRQGLESRWDEDSGETADKAVDGTTRVRSFYADTQYNITVIHPRMTTAEKTALLSFWDTNKASYNTITNEQDGADYSVLFLGIPKFKRVNSGVWAATVHLAGTKL